jgi:hypothetical protein
LRLVIKKPVTATAIHAGFGHGFLLNHVKVMNAAARLR